MSWDAENWISTSAEYADRLNAGSTLELSNNGYDDFTGRALFYESADAEKPFPLDLIVTNIDFSINEHTQVEQHIGNCFSFIAFGKDAMTCMVSGVIPDTGTNFGKDTFMDIYRNYLRLEAVARRGVAPILCFPNAAFYCAAMSVNISETAEQEDMINIAMNLDIMKAVFIAGDYNFMLDYIHGIELSEDSINETGTITGLVKETETTDTSGLLIGDVVGGAIVTIKPGS